MIAADTLEVWEDSLLGWSLDYDLFDPEGRALFRGAVEKATEYTTLALLWDLIGALAAQYGVRRLPACTSRVQARRALADIYIDHYLDSTYDPEVRGS